MQQTRNSQRHVVQVSWNDVRELVMQTNQALAKAIDRLAQQANLRKSSFPLYRVRYGYGRPVVTTRKDRSRQFHPPCDAEDCEGCNALAKACTGDLPLGLLLQNAAEVYSEDKLATASERPCVPVRMLHAGEIFGVINLLGRLTDFGVQSTGFNWNIVAGARTVMCSFPVSDKQLVKNILRRSLGYMPSKEQISEARTIFEWDNRELIFALLKAAAREQKMAQFSLDWNLEVLIIPATWVTGLIHTKKTREANPLLDVLKDIGLQTLAVLRNQAAMEAQIAGIVERIHCVPRSTFFQRTVAHNLGVFNRTKPGYRPVGKDDFAGPFFGILRFIWATGLAKSSGLKGRFPLLLQPDQFSERSKTFLYYSLQEPTVPGPIEKKNGTRTDALWDLQMCLREIKKQAPGLLPAGLAWTFLSAHPDGNDIIGPAGIEIKHIRNCPELLTDFADQWQLAQELWRMNSTISFFHNVKQKFMAAFVRFQLAEGGQAKLSEKIA